MSNKKYFWLKLHKDFFKSKEMKKLRKIAGGDTYTIIYLKLQLLSLEDSGKLFFEGIEETFAEELALEIDESFENVQATFMFLQRVGLLEMVENDELSLTHLVENIGSETPSASRKRIQRNKEKQHLTANSVTLSQGSHKNVTTEKEIELDIEKELEIKTEIKTEKNLVRENAFESFWSLYDLKKNKVKSKALFMKLNENDFEEMRTRVKNYVDNTNVDGSYPSRMHPTTYLNNANKLWMDEVKVMAPSNNQQDDRGGFGSWPTTRN